ncbi:histone deacetylase [Desulfobacula sp.]|uniref:histone deacetylase family protein n=1 Tax=Desulfobacula sp. TaxID=2593537 RepID=UPI00262CC764|nr:histone deacetylase [Desulfobacula sp.]
MMLTRENIRQAIDAIAKREPEIAYTLHTMLGKGSIDLLSASETLDEKKLYFTFGDKKPFVNKYQFFAGGTPCLEQVLLIQYGELARTRDLFHLDPVAAPGKMASKTDTAGLSLMLNYEIDLAADLLKKNIAAILKKNIQADEIPLVKLLRNRLQKILDLRNDSTDQIDFKDFEDDPRILFRGVVDEYTMAAFMRFPFSRDSLIQAGRLNLEFFHVRFLLNCLVTGTDHMLFACVAKGEIQGLIFLEMIRKLFYRGLEVKYVATRGGADSPLDPRPVKGAGTFIMAGVWGLWKSNLPEVKELVLESEIEAEKFYTAIGFHSRGLCRYTLKSPEGRLLTTIAAIAASSEKIHPSITSHLCKRVPDRIRLLKGKKTKNGQHRNALAFIKLSLHPASSDLLARTTVTQLLKNKSRIPEGEALLTLAKAFGRTQTEPLQTTSFLPVAIVIDKRYRNHLKGVAHLENYRRIKAVEDLLTTECLAGKWVKIAPRFADKKELIWVHTPEYVEKIETTAGKGLTSLDFDTQTTEESWSTARLAAGGVFSLLDRIMSGRSSRGFAFVRPPGHHAGPAGGSGFCIFNNIALGAKYLKHQYKVSKLMIIDIDAHHGNGTQEIFYNTDEVLFVSIHESNSFPGTGRVEETGSGKGQGFTINIPLEKGSRARDIGRALCFLAGPIAQEYRPEIILVSFGFDLYIHDRLSGMNVTPGGYALITALLLEVAAHASVGKIAFVMEGGYSLMGIRECGLAVMKEICNVPGISEDKIDRVRKSDFSHLSNLKRVIEVHKKYWEVLW